MKSTQTYSRLKFFSSYDSGCREHPHKQEYELREQVGAAGLYGIESKSPFHMAHSLLSGPAGTQSQMYYYRHTMNCPLKTGELVNINNPVYDWWPRLQWAFLVI